MGKGAPESDPRIGEAAMLSAKTGTDYLAWAKDQAKITNGWATEDRARYNRTFKPVEDKFIADAATYAGPERKEAQAAQAVADVNLAIGQQDAARKRDAMAMGVNPNSGRFAAAAGRAATDGALAAAGAANMSRRAVDAEGRALTGEVINMGKGLAVNPATSMGMSSGVTSSGFQGAMSGYGQQGQLLNQDYQNRMQSWQASQAATGSVFGALGSVVGALPWGTGILSDEDAKTNKGKPKRSMLKAVEKMRVDEWDYKPGMGDGGHHVGTYAQDFTRETGLGDGRKINVIDGIGVTMGAVKDLSRKVDRIERHMRMAA